MTIEHDLDLHMVEEARSVNDFGRSIMLVIPRTEHGSGGKNGSVAGCDWG